MLEGVKVFECQIAAISDLIEGLDDGGPVRRAIQQCSEVMQVELLRSLVPFLEVNVFDPLSEHRNPMFGKLILHDVPGVEMNLYVLALEAVDERIHLLRAEQKSVHEDIFNVD